LTFIYQYAILTGVLKRQDKGMADMMFFLFGTSVIY